ncbi:sugar diacid recognition domain-containing protein [Paenibacillus sp. JCM 10914]|uniref:CdaR family transcriptional regulator n=1 Tax=Paenibacillus sp. JCM 10914 TaxID=1236974 RepID=UPI0003CC6114|nr:sugar diacid recognition domain-containing protein [Paenibacillus sp. JCM 10914]GAE08439.1 sugar diacid utilization regulator SdaR [Paenibacillus sp. JCM 10914]
MYQLSEALAQEIVDRMMNDIPYNINIMNDQGVIIGSGNSGRIGTEHRGAIKALESGEMVEVWEDQRYEKKGTNEPIVINQVRVGVIGISGNPEEVRPFCNIVRTTVVLLIEQRMALESMHSEANRKKAFLEVLLHHQGIYTQKLQKKAIAYNIDLLLPTTILYIEHAGMNTEMSNLLLMFPSFILEADICMILVQDAKEIKKVVKQLLQSQPLLRISVSRHGAHIADGYYQSKSAMRIGRALQLPEKIILYDQVEFLVKLSESELGTEHHIMKLEDKDSVDLLETLRVFIHNNGSMSDTSAELNIHRNTLQYRLRRIHDLTGKDPRNTLDLFELTHGLLKLYK